MNHRFQSILQHLEDHLNDPVTLDQLAAEAGLSKYYLIHLFQAETGYTVMDYLRRRRLEEALISLKDGNRILDAALDAGYGSEQAFSRAVRRTFGQPPSAFRMDPPIRIRRLKSYDRTLQIDPQRILKGLPPAFRPLLPTIEQGVSSMQDYLSDVRYEILPAMTVVCGIAIGSEPEDEILGRMDRLAKAWNLKVSRRFGFDSLVEGSEDVTALRGYEAWLVIDPTQVGQLSTSLVFEDTRLTIKQIPSLRYAILRITDPFAAPFERIPGGWQALVAWLEEHDFKDPDFKHDPKAPCLEEVLTVDGKTVMDLLVAIDRA